MKGKEESVAVKSTCPKVFVDIGHPGKEEAFLGGHMVSGADLNGQLCNPG